MKNLKVTAAILAAAIVAGSFSGCKIAGREVFFSTGSGVGNVFRIGNLRCSEKEARVYLANYHNLYRSVGEVDLWSANLNTDHLTRNLKQAVLDHLSMVYAMDEYAKEENISLSDSEEQKIADAAEAYYDSLTVDDRAYLRTSEGDIRRIYEHYALAQKVYARLMTQVDEEVSEDEARIMDAYVIDLSQGSQTDAAAADAALKVASTPEQAAAVAQKYSQNEKEMVSFGRGTYPTQVEEAAFALDDGESSGQVVTDQGIYLIYCVDKYDKKLSEENKINVIAARKKALISEIITKQTKDKFSYLNQSAWDSLDADPGNSVKTNSFFTIFNENIAF
ncbi:MAG: peptidyl-prolyl cis-trans isomerase [Lachnospiraceae bacterium]|nr:peptidyl-prolyl cis-trans isomerase [Lachnospiraceae bacterium]